MTPTQLAKRLPWPLPGLLVDFELRIVAALSALAARLPHGARILDAGAGEGQYYDLFPNQRLTGVDLAIGDHAWDYSRLHAVADLTRLPFPDNSFAACLNIVTLEHVQHPQLVLAELHRVLAPGGELLLVVPQQWEVHQAPHDYFRYTRYGTELLLRHAGFASWQIQPAGGYFRLLARRLWGGQQFLPGPLRLLWLLAVALPALLLPLCDGLDQRKDFTLGYICTAKKATS